ncbi:hypothetical protein POTOM_025876 [Populus tomentosa]|uniref:Calcineurin-like metallo-phosphoesterase superfamily protein n=1 Tax=Populus tomentosa TaxID=118781 RepID=A0A8X7ZJF1_POPTO|nr:hypothetical protein POTOM_025876 [Populus tomentosa]
MMSLSALIHAPSPCFLSTTHRSTSSPDPSTVRSSSMAASARIAVVGDVHDDWNLEEDSKALQLLQGKLKLKKWVLSGRCVKMVFSVIIQTRSGALHRQVFFSLFVSLSVCFTLGLDSDFGNENVELVQSIADLNLPKVVILGNHDSWKTQHFSGKRKDGVQRQLECLGEEHVAYKRLDFPTLKLSVVGGRPFSCGGEQIFRRSLLSARYCVDFFTRIYSIVPHSSITPYPLPLLSALLIYGIQDMDGSADRIYNAALGTPEDHMVILLAHNGPTGLGSNLNDICGKDWVFGGGDHGDPDLAQAISHLKETTTISIPLVVFGHMHKELAYGNGLRKMIVVGADKTIYLNGAIVPRVRRLVAEQGTGNTNFMNNETSVFSPGSRGTMRAFTLVEILEGRVDKIAETWVSVIEDETAIEEEHVLFQRGN